jgi:hypothetical protein
MVERQDSKYDPKPWEPPAEGEESEDTSEGFFGIPTELSSGVPTVSVHKEALASFNKDPEGAGGKPTDEIPPVPEFGINLASMRDSEEFMLADAKTAVDAYEELRKKFMAEKDSVFGQGQTYEESVWGGPGTAADTTTSPSPWAASGEEFASQMNPLQEKVLVQIGSVLESVGEYIATLNRVGQMYSAADRKSVFPEPPPPK